MMPQAPRSDTTGWFARDAATFARVSAAMLGEASRDGPLDRVIVAVDAFGFADPEVAAALRPVVERLGRLAREVREDVLAPPGLSLWGARAADAAAVGGVADLPRLGRPGQPARCLQRRARADRGRGDPGERARLGRADAREARAAWRSSCRRARSSACRRRRSRRRSRASRYRRWRRCATASLCLCAHGGLTGVPQVSLPRGDRRRPAGRALDRRRPGQRRDADRSGAGLARYCKETDAAMQRCRDLKAHVQHAKGMLMKNERPGP